MSRFPGVLREGELRGNRKECGTQVDSDLRVIPEISETRRMKGEFLAYPRKGRVPRYDSIPAHTS